MSSQLRIESSRANGAKSRGPKTADGKRKSARNSQRHGILARTVVLTDENPKAFQRLLRSLELHFLPQDEFEHNCVDAMAVARWRAMRIWGIERAGLDHEIGKQNSSDYDAPTRAHLAFRTLCDESRSADLLGRYETRYDRQYARAFNLLLKGRARINTEFPHEPSRKIGL